MMRDDINRSAPRNRPVHAAAPTATGTANDVERDHDSWPVQPPESTGVPAESPLLRPLRIYAFGPSLGRARGNIRTINVRYEKLKPGPVGERIAVVDYDATRD